MEYFGAKFVKHEVNSILKTCGMKKNDRIGSFIHLILAILFFIGIFFALIGLYKNAFPAKTVQELYISTQTIYENSPKSDFSYLDIDGKAWFVPLPWETIQAAIKFGEDKGEENKIYLERVVVMALDPSIRYAEISSATSLGTAYKPQDIYTFYLPDGEDIKDERAREHLINVKGTNYRIVLLSIDGRGAENRRSYTFRIEEMIR